MKISPEETFSRPASIRNVVVFPQPDGPSSTTNSPSRISSDRSSTTRVPPKCLLTLRNSIPIQPQKKNCHKEAQKHKSVFVTFVPFVANLSPLPSTVL